MADLRGKLRTLYSLEQLSQRLTSIHALHPLVKLLGTAAYLIAVMSFPRYAVLRLAPYLLYPAVLMALAEIPWGMIARRAAVAMPFCLFAGLSNILLDRTVLASIGPLGLSGGVLSCGSIALKTLLSVAAVLILVAVTPFRALTGQLRRMHVPELLTSLFEMTYRYLGTLVEEAGGMYTAYRLRSGAKRGLALRDMGSFVGQLLLRSFDRAERVYHAMTCRGYGAADPRRDRRPLAPRDWAFLLLVAGGSILFRLVDVPLLLGRGMEELYRCWS